jgi:hypothetical protein
MALVALAAGLLLLPALLQPSHLLYPSWSDFSDLTLIHWPKVTLLRDSLAAQVGWPLWSPYGLSGQPLAANQLAMLFYPPVLLLLLGPLPTALALFLALHLAWAGLGAYFLARVLGLRPDAALLAGVLFALNGKLAAHTAIGHASLVPAVAWAPWALACLHLALTRRSTAAALLAGVALAAQLATHTYALLFTAYGLAAYALLTLFWAADPLRSRLAGALRSAPRLLLVPATGVLLGAAQLLPLLEMAPYSNRNLGLAEATRFSLSPLQTMTGLLFPSAAVGHEAVIYPGIVGMILALTALPRVLRRRPAAVIALLTGAAVLLALGSYTPLFRLAYSLLPGLRWLRTPGRLWFFAGLGLAILAAYGWEAWQAPRQGARRRTSNLLLVGVMGGCLALSLGAMLILELEGRTAWGVGVWGALTAGLLLGMTHRRPRPAHGWLALLLVVLDLLTFDVTLVRCVPLAQIAAQGLQPAAWLASQEDPGRVYSPSYSLPQPAASLVDLEQMDGVEPVHLADYDRFMALAGGYGDASFSVTVPPFPEGVALDEAHRETVPDPQLLGLLNGRYLAAAFPLEVPDLTLRYLAGNTWIYENESALPRAFVTHRSRPASQEEAWAWLQGTDLSRVALVEGGPALAGPAEPSPARVVERSPNRLVIETDLPTPGLLLVGEIWYPGWEASDNGHTAPILRADAILRAVYLEPGSHRVELLYRPPTVYAGLAVTAATGLALLIAGAVALLARRKRARQRLAERAEEP